MSDVADARAPDAARHLKAFAALGARPLRLAGVCTVLAGALLVPQALLIARAMQQVFVDHAPVRAVAALLAGLAVVGMLRALLGWASRRLADEAVETVRVQVRAAERHQQHPRRAHYPHPQTGQDHRGRDRDRRRVRHMPRGE